MSPRRNVFAPRPFPSPPARPSIAVESLEERRLFAWGPQATLIGQDLAAAKGVFGAGTSIAILDTGIDYMHPSLGGGFGAGYKVSAGWDFVDNDADPMDTHGHGTAVAGMAAALAYSPNGQQFQGIARDADLIALRVDTAAGLSWNVQKYLIEDALQWVIAHRVEHNIVAVNMSFGFGDSRQSDSPFNDELQTLYDAGVFLAAAAGNSGTQNVGYPAIDPNVYAVGGVNPNGTFWSSSTRGPNVDLLAPAVDLTVPWYYVGQANPHGYIVNSADGTSFAAPQAAALAAVLRQIDPTLTPAQILSIMQDSGDAVSDGTRTYSRINVNKAITAAYNLRDDAAENNDTAASARALPFSNDTASLAGLKLLGADADWFKFTLAGQADVDFSLTLGGSGYAGPASVKLVDANGVVIKTLSSTDQVRLTAGTYFIQVAAQTVGLGGTYGIAVTQTPDDGSNNHTPATARPIPLDGNGTGSVSGMVLLGGVPDYYSFTLGNTRDVDLAAAFGAGSPLVSVQLLDTNGVLIATFANDGTLARRLTAGRYLIRVSSAETLEETYGVNVNARSIVPPGANGSSNGIAYDSASRLHLAYYDEATKNLKYALRGADGVWAAVTTVDAGFMAGQFVSLALDPQGRAGIAYYDANNADLKYAHFNGSSWDVQTVDAQFTTGYYPSLQYGAGGLPVISYYSKTAGDLKLAAHTGAGWALSTIDSAGDVGRYSSLAYNPASGRWAVAYEDTGRGAFKYADQGKSAWTPTTVDATTRIGGGYVSLAFSAKTKLPAMTYYDAYNADLKYAAFTGTRWNTQAVATKGTVGLYSTLRINPTTGLADVLYYNKAADIVLRASQSSSGTWGLSQVTTDGGRWISRAFDTSGNETLAYLTDSEITMVDL